jgi:hypothetical protein
MGTNRGAQSSTPLIMTRSPLLALIMTRSPLLALIMTRSPLLALIMTRSPRNADDTPKTAGCPP